MVYVSTSSQFYVRDMTLEQAICSNDALVHTCEYPKERDEIYRCFYEKGFSAMFSKYYKEPFLKKIKKKVKKILKMLMV